MDEFRNSNGTYNGIKFMAALTGLSVAEVEWSASRLKHLIHVKKKSKEEATAIVKEEGKTKPWLGM